jgi:hypothetical protein
MRRKVTALLLNRLGVKVGSITIITNKENEDTRVLFENNKEVIKKLYPSAVKLKLKKK